MRDSRVAALAIAGVLVLVVDGSQENRGVVEALRNAAEEQAVCERQVGRNLSRLVRDEWPELAAPAMESLLGPDPFFAEVRSALNQRSEVTYFAHHACTVARRHLRLTAHDTCSRTRTRCHA